MKFRAFISYSHEEDKELSTELQHALETYAKKWYEIRRIRIFRDETNLTTTPSLWSSIEEALNQSEFFLYLASSKAAKSKWVEKEVQWWLKNKDPKKIIIILTEGTIDWCDETSSFDNLKTDAISKNILRLFKDEPFYIDISWAKSLEQAGIRSNLKFNDEISSVASAILYEDKDYLVGYNSKQRKIRKKVVQGSILILTSLSIILAATAIFAFKKMDEAIKAQKQAEDISSVLLINYRYVSGKFEHIPNMSDKMVRMTDRALKNYYANINLKKETDNAKLMNTAAYYSNLQDKFEHEGKTEEAQLAYKKTQKIAKKLMPRDISQLAIIINKLENSVEIDLSNINTLKSISLLSNAVIDLKENNKKEARNKLDDIFLRIKILSNSPLGQISKTDRYILYKSNLLYYKFERNSKYFIKAIDLMKSLGKNGVLSTDDFILLDKYRYSMSKVL